MPLIVGSNASASLKAISSNYGSGSTSSKTPTTTTTTKTGTSSPTTTKTVTSYKSSDGLTLTPAEYNTVASKNPSLAAQFSPVYSSSSGSSSTPKTTTTTTPTTTSSGGASTTQFYRDSSGNIVNASGGVVMTAATLSKMDSTTQANALKFPILGSQATAPVQQQAQEPTKLPKKDQTQATQDQGVPTVSPAMINSDGDPYFLGDYGLVNYGGTIWLVDNERKTLRPFASEAAFNNMFDDPISAKAAIANIDQGSFMDGGTLQDYTVLDRSYAIQFDGTYKEYEPAKLQARYGNEIDTNLEQSAYMTLDGFMDLLASEDSGISADALNKIKKDKNSIAKYINALAYGGYTLSDVYRDIARQDLISQGKAEYSSVNPISTDQVRTAYQGTAAGKAAYNDPLLNPPARLAGIDATTMNLPLYNIPDEAFKTLIPLMDYNSAEFRTAMSEIESAYHDVLLQQLEAQTEQEKAIADYNYERFKEDISKKYGIMLSNNAIDAWDQIVGLRSQYNERGISGSGMQQEGIDSYLAKVRRTDQQARDERLTEEEAQKANYYLQYAGKDEIKALVDSDPELAKKWGLVPSDDVKNALSFSTMRAKYPPEVTDQEIMDYISTVLDENGNYRSALYQKYATGALNIKQDKETYQQSQVLQKSLNAEEKAYADYTTPDSPFLRYAGDTTDTTKNINDISLPKMSSVTGQTTTGQFDNPLKTAISTAKTTTPTATPTTTTSGSKLTIPVTGGGGVSGGAISLNQSQLDLIKKNNPTLYNSVIGSTQSTPVPTKTTSTTVSKPTSGTTTGTATYKLVDPSGKVVNTFNSTDKAAMEKMGLASGYKFI